MPVSRAHKISLLCALYFGQGLPFGFFSLALPVLLRDAGYSLKAISALSLVSLPWALKFLWAPWLDQLGARRTWLLFLQLSSIGAAVILSQLEPSAGYVALVAAAFIFNIIAASQDVLTDGLAVRMLDARERGLGNGIQVGAYRFGMILGGGLLLWLFAKTNWTIMFSAMAVLLALTIPPVVQLREQDALRAPSAGAAQLSVAWAKRLFAPGMLGFMFLIFCYRYGDQMVSSLLGPFLHDFGLSRETIALMKGTVGSATSLLGAVLGAWLTFSSGRRTAVLASGVAQAACFSLYIAAALGLGGVGLLWAATIAEGVIGTMATVALFTLMMDASDPDHAGVDYTLLASAVVLISSIGNVSGAVVADAFGYAATFTLGAVLALLGCLIVIHRLDRNPGPARVAQVWGA